MTLREWIDNVQPSKVVARVENDDSEGCQWLVLTSLARDGRRMSSYYINIDVDEVGGK